MVWIEGDYGQSLYHFSDQRDMVTHSNANTNTNDTLTQAKGECYSAYRMQNERETKGQNCWFAEGYI